jgi:hypothetical protein
MDASPGSAPRSSRRRLATLGILAVGWAAALAVYLSAGPVEDDPEAYDLTHSRIYDRQLEVIGGKAAIMGRDLQDWLASLGHGRRLAYPIAAATIVVALGYRAWDRDARPLP